MLFGPPPGYNAASINRQNVGMMNTPGMQGGVAQGNPGAQYNSNYSLPSSYHVPSSIDAPNPYYTQPRPQLHPMVKALRGGF